MSKLVYSKPTVTKIGSLTQTTEGGYNWQIMEILSRRGRTEN